MYAPTKFGGPSSRERREEPPLRVDFAAPELLPEDFRGLVADMRAGGQLHEPGLMQGDAILFVRMRLMFCRGSKMRTVQCETLCSRDAESGLSTRFGSDIEHRWRDPGRVQRRDAHLLFEYGPKSIAVAVLLGAAWRQRGRLVLLTSELLRG